MNIKPGAPAPLFTTRTASGRVFDLEEQLGHGPVVIFFYPKAFTPGCTAQSCHFRDAYSEFKRHGATVVGISCDTADSQAGFSSRNSLGFEMIPDPSGRVASRYGAKRRGLKYHRRMTVVIGTDRRILEVIRTELNTHAHADRALAALGAAPRTIVIPELQRDTSST